MCAATASTLGASSNSNRCSWTQVLLVRQRHKRKASWDGATVRCKQLRRRDNATLGNNRRRFHKNDRKRAARLYLKRVRKLFTQIVIPGDIYIYFLLKLVSFLQVVLRMSYIHRRTVLGRNIRSSRFKQLHLAPVPVRLAARLTARDRAASGRREVAPTWRSTCGCRSPQSWRRRRS